ncbi:uncharacterized protein LOC113338566 [Papaver somniferum]|uniref:uncharacterized protein LOC113338566 n=1 Tax=Papaver somniferum TaxID=3469 RepID=UPI000E6FA2EB|nr:uncharacterized protein LOC113338566 [Papaver somniferum]
MKLYADSSRVERTFQEGDLVYLKLQPYRQDSVSLRRNFKLSSKYYGPFKVLHKVGVVAYKLDLPSHSRIHPVFHVSQLKQHIGMKHNPSPTLPVVDLNSEVIMLPEKVLQTRTVLRGIQHKGDHSFPRRLLQPLPIPDTAWKDISLDFIEGIIRAPTSSLSVSNSYSTSVTTVEDYLHERDLMLQLLKHDLSKAQRRMKFFADQKRSDREFAVGDMVFLKLQPYRKTSVAIRKNFKLSPKYFGPFEVIQRICAVAYKLKLPVGSRIHPIFYVSQLKKKIGLNAATMPQLPQVDHNVHYVIEPLDILDRRLTLRNNSSVPQVLVHWSNSSLEDATWADTVHIQSQFPDFILEDKDA